MSPCLAGGWGSYTGPSQTMVLVFCLNHEPASTQLTVYRTKRNWILEEGIQGREFTESRPLAPPYPKPFQKGRGESSEGKKDKGLHWQSGELDTLAVGWPTPQSSSIPSALPLPSKYTKQASDVPSGLPCIQIRPFWPLGCEVRSTGTT